MIQYILLGSNVGFTTYNRTKDEMVFTQEAILITAHGKTSHCTYTVFEEELILLFQGPSLGIVQQYGLD